MFWQAVRPAPMEVARRLRELLALAPADLRADTPLDRLPLVAFDLETTGFHPYGGDVVIEIGAVRRAAPQEEFQTLVSPGAGGRVPDLVVALTGISPEALGEAPSALTALTGFLEFTPGAVLCAYAADFDLAFINVLLRRACGQRLRQPVIDTLILAQALFPTWPDHGLDALAQRLELPASDRHRALPDARLALAVAERLFGVARERHIDTFGDLKSYLHWRRLS